VWLKALARCYGFPLQRFRAVFEPSRAVDLVRTEQAALTIEVKDLRHVWFCLSLEN
jgi:hypothetical protein